MIRISQPIKYIGLIFLTLCFVSCASKSLPKGAKASFKTRISESGLKHFEVSFRSKEKKQKNKKNSRSRQEPSSARIDRSAFKKKQQQLEYLAHEEILRTGYCKKGFWIIKNDADALTPYLRGECNELANNDERRKFPDTIKNW